MKKIIKKTALVVALSVAISPFQGEIFHNTIVVEAANTITSYADLQTAASKGGTYTLGASVSVKEPIEIPKGKTLTLRQDSGNTFVIGTKTEDIKNIYEVSGTLKLGTSATGTVNVRGGDSDGKRYTTNAIIAVNDGGTLEVENAKLYHSKSRAILISGGTVNMTGGIITTNDAVNSSKTYGGAIMVKDSGKFTMSGGTISKNDHGAVYISSSAVFHMKGGVITNNAAGAGKLTTNTLQYGGGVYVDNGTFYMTGGKIYGNTSYKAGAGVCVDEKGTFNVSGSPYIESTDDVYLSTGQKIYVKDTLQIPNDTMSDGKTAISAPLFTINTTFGEEQLGKTVAASSIDALSGSEFIKMFALKNSNYTLAAEGKNINISKICTLKYNGNGGLNVPESQSVNWNETVSVSSIVPTRTGYTFLGWNSDIDGKGSSYSSGGSIVITKNTELYAQWSENNITVTYHANGGERAPAGTTEKYSKGVTITYDIPTRTGYTFIGWNTRPDGTGTNYNGGNVVQEDLTLYAQWKADTISVTYNQNDGSNKENIVVEGNASQGIAVKSEVPVREGYIFTGWNTAQDGSGASYSEGTILYQNTILYAQWKKMITYTLTYDVQGGYFKGAVTEKYVSGTIAVVTSEKPLKDGYTFIGWNTKEDGSGEMYMGDSAVTINGNITLYAQWEKNKSTQGAQTSAISQYAPKLKVTSKGTKLALSWTFNGDVDGYEVYVSSSSTKGRYTSVKDVKKLSASYTDSALKSGKTAKIKVTAYKVLNGKKVYSKYSNVVSKTLISKPAISSVKYKKKAKKATIKWKSIPGITKYVIYQKAGKGKYKKIYSAKAASNTITISLKSVKKGKKVSYKIRAYKKVGSTKVYSPYSAVKSVKKTN